jgi:Ribosomal RNA adenine dimethylase
MYGPPFPKSKEEWENLWSPYTESTYRAVLACITPTDSILEIGAGDLRLALRLAGVAYKVYAIENDPGVLACAPRPLPDNLEVLQGDARFLEFPSGVTCGVLMMRHCLHFRQYAQKLKQSGATRLISNARWRYEPEVIDLLAIRLPYEKLGMGWFACWCGATGFKEGPVEKISAKLLEIVYEVQDCPKCAS